MIANYIKRHGKSRDFKVDIKGQLSAEYLDAVAGINLPIFNQKCNIPESCIYIGAKIISFYQLYFVRKNRIELIVLDL